MKKSILLILSLFSASLFADVQLSPLPLPQIGKVSQFDLSEQGELVVITFNSSGVASMPVKCGAEMIPVFSWIDFTILCVRSRSPEFAP
ncbi:Uncharacterised protein [Mannheimia haemolytica]|nr:Uncharacterised protein [Mannheimia haemolytica]